MRAALACCVLVLLAACGGGSGEEVASVNVGGTLSGLGAGKSVVIADASGPSASLSANGNYSLSIAPGAAYNLRIATQPAGQTCAIANGSGTANADVGNIAVICTDNPVSPEAKVVSGIVAGLGAGTLVLQLNTPGGTQETAVSANGGFSFAQPVTGDYTVTVKTAPAGQACTVAVSGAITITCASTAFKLGGTVNGNTGVVAIRNAANGDTVTLNTNGAFTFAQPVLQGGSYSVAVFDQSAGQTCGTANGNGIASAAVDNIQVTCSAVVVVTPPTVVPVVAPSTPTGLTMTYGAKSFNLAWGTVTAPVGGGTVTYRLFEDPDGAGAVAGTQVGGTLTGGTYTRAVNAMLHTRLNAQYTVQACNSVGCSSPTAAITPNVNQAIGYFKASNPSTGSTFGETLALSSNGTTLAVGAPRESGGGTGVYAAPPTGLPAATSSGAVYVFTKTGGVWSPAGYFKASNPGSGDFFGSSVALSADGFTLAVGAIYEDSAATGTHVVTPGDGGGASQSGAVYVYSRYSGSWSQEAYIKASNTQAPAQFGNAVSLSATGDLLAVGSYQENAATTGTHAVTPAPGGTATSSGAAYVYSRSAGVWSLQAYVKASNTGAGDNFGRSVALSSDGLTLAVGAPREQSASPGINGDQGDNTANGIGAAYVFTRSGSAWTQQAYVKAASPVAGAAFGYAVALSGVGDTLAVGALGERTVHVFRRSAGNWTQDAVMAPTPASPIQFGWSLGLTGDGNVLVVGAYADSQTATGVHVPAPPATPVTTSVGAAFLFTRNAGVWSQTATFKAPNAEASDLFGRSVGLSADGFTLAVGADGESSNATGIGGNQADNSAGSAGAVYLY